MSNSSLICYTKISPNQSGARNHVIDTISIHCMAGNLRIETCGEMFARSSTEASSNYGIGTDGRIGLYVEEKDRSWCTSSRSNDNRAITIEVANDGGESTGWHVSNAAYTSLINLLVDICKRNNIKKLLWRADKSLIGNVALQNMTVHRWFAAKACPGDYLYNLHSKIASEVNSKLSGSTESVESTPIVSTSTNYTVRVTADDLNIRKGPGTSYGTNGSITNKGIYTIVQESNGWGKLKSGAGWIDLSYTEKVTSATSSTTSTPYTVKVTADALNIRKGPGTSYASVGMIKNKGVYTIVEESNGWGKLKSGAGWISLSYTKRL
jgi:SH3-like domain-containing protein